MSKKTEIEVTLKDMMELRDGSSRGELDWALFTVAIGLAERLEMIIERLEEQISN